MVIHIPLSAILRLVLILGVFGGTFGIAWGVVEWRAADKDNVDEIWRSLDAISSKLQTVQGDLQTLEGDLGRLDNRVSKVETPAPIANLDIQELYARTAYQACVHDADLKMGDAEWALAESYRAYLAENKTYSEYQADYEAYLAVYDAYDVETDACWATYSQESPYDSPDDSWW